MKNNILFACSNCDAQYQKWVGRCLECNKWGTIDKDASAVQNIKKDELNYPILKTQILSSVLSANVSRIKMGISELDRVLGGGFVPGSLVLMGGQPGIGKSTLALQISAIVKNTLYFSGEESVEQIKLRSERLHIDSSNLYLANGTSIDSLIATVKKEKDKYKLVVVDSIQVVSTSEAEGHAGNINQVRACTTKLIELAKSTNIPVIIIGQVTKDGSVAGPKTLEHLVDTVLYLEGSKFHEFRILRAAKNRFGSTDEVGIFSMKETGLEEVMNPSEIFIKNKPQNVPGSTVAVLMEGTRPLLVEIQALVCKTSFGYPQRKSSGFDLNRLQVLIAVLSRRSGLPLDSYDVFLNVAGGMKASEPAADLAVVIAITSALKNKVLKNSIVSFGEVGLGGEIRGVTNSKKRLQEIKKLGFEFAVIPSSTKEKISDLKIARVENVLDLVEKVIK